MDHEEDVSFRACGGGLRRHTSDEPAFVNGAISEDYPHAQEAITTCATCMQEAEAEEGAPATPATSGEPALAPAAP